MTGPEPRPPEAPSGAIWLQILILVQVIYVVAGITFSGDLLRGPNSAWAVYNRERIAAFADRFAPERPPVVVIGNSTVKTGLLDWTEDDDAAAPVLRIVDDHAFFDNFEAVLPDVLAARPRILVVQTALLQTQPNWRADLSRFRLSQTGWLLAPEDVEHVQFGDVCPDVATTVAASSQPAIDAQLTEHLTWQAGMTRSDADGRVPRRARAFVERAAAEQIRVVLLDLPRAPTLERHEPHADAALRSLADDLDAASDWIDVLRVPQLADDAFCDLRHYTPEGREQVSAWVDERLAELLARP